MAKLIAEIVNAGDLLSTDGHGSASPFVQVEFDGHRQRTKAKTRDLNPSWNEKLVFNIHNPRNLSTSTIEVTVYDDRSNNFLGCVRISGASVPLSESEASVQRYPLYKRGFFSHGRGDIALRIYAVRAHYIRGQQTKPLLRPKTKQYPPILPPIWYSYLGSDVGDGDMPLLFVNVVRARDLPVVDPCVEVNFNNQNGVTEHIENNQNPVWDHVFAFSQHGGESSLIQVVVKDLVVGEFVGMTEFDAAIDAPLRSSNDGHLTPRWYELVDRTRHKARGEIMMAVWFGTQADAVLREACRVDNHHHSIRSGRGRLTLYCDDYEPDINTKSNVYVSPSLYYLTVGVIEAQDLVPSDKSRPPQFCVKVQIGRLAIRTEISQIRHCNPVWNEELMWVVSENQEEFIVIDVMDRIGPRNHELIGRITMPVNSVPLRVDDYTGPVEPKWFNLHEPSSLDGGEKKKKEGSKILLTFVLETGHHVFDESMDFSSDYQPSSEHLRKDRVGVLELGILSAQNLLPMKQKDGGTSADSYCVAKYGNKWVRTRTILNCLEPCWNEHYSWDVYDPYTVITVGVFDNGDVNRNKRDETIGRVRIRLSTLETNHNYTNYYPLLFLSPSGLKKSGELKLALRFTSVGWVKMVAQYGRPLLPKMHYVKPINLLHLDHLRQMAQRIVATQLSKADPPLKREVVEYMLDTSRALWCLRIMKANFQRLMSLVLCVTAAWRWLDDIRRWRKPLKTIFVHFFYLLLVYFPKLILPLIFLSLSITGLWNYRLRPRNPPQIDLRVSNPETMDLDCLDEELDTFPTSMPNDIVRMRYDRLKSIAGRYQTVVGDIATQGERVRAIFSWRDPRATFIFTVIALVCAVLLYATPFHLVAGIFGVYWLRHPRFRNNAPSVPMNLFNRLSSKYDMFL